MKLMLVLIMSVLSTTVLSESSAPIKSPDSIEGATKINSEELIELVNDVENLVLIDSRETSNRTFGYIEGSVGLQDTDTNCESLKNVIESTQSSVVFYCNGPKCGRSVTAANIALSCGYSNLFWFRGGIEEWRHKSYPLAVD